MQCPVLSDISAAEFEARAKVDLAARSPRGGELQIICDGLAATIRWRERTGAWFLRVMPPAVMPAMLVDALLVASKELVEASSLSTSATPGEKSPSLDPPPQGAPEPADAREEGTDAAEVAVPPPGQRQQKRVPQRTETAPLIDWPPAAASSPEAWAWGVAAGARGALFTLRGTGVVGPGAGVFLHLPAGWVAHLAGEYDVAVGAGDVVSARVATATAVIAARFGRKRAFEVGIGGLAGSVFANSEAPYQPSSLSQGFWGAIVRARYALRSDLWRFAFGPDARFYGFRPEVAVDRAVVWGLPVVSIGLAVEVSRELFGSPER
jgi:hypothetical protein